MRVRAGLELNYAGLFEIPDLVYAFCKVILNPNLIATLIQLLHYPTLHASFFRVN